MDEKNDAILSQSDIDALLHSGASLESGPVIRSNGVRISADESIQVSSYDFSDPVYLDERTMARLKERVDSFVHALNARLAVFLKLNVSVKLGEVRTSPYQSVVESFTPPTFISIFKLEPLLGVGLMNFPPTLAMAMIDRMLGGMGIAPSLPRYLTEIESVLLEDVIDLFLEEWVRPWEPLLNISFSKIGFEKVGAFLQTASAKSVVIVIPLEVTALDCTQIVQLVIPYSLFEPILHKMELSDRRFAEETSKGLSHNFNKELCDQLEIPLVAQWDACSISLGDFLRLRPGDVLELPRNILGETKVLFSGSPRFKAEIGIEQGRVAVRLTESLDS